MRSSESDRTIACPASLVLPRAPRPASPGRDDAADYGTLVHFWKELGYPDENADPRHIALLEKKLLLTGLQRDEWWPEGGTHELTFSLHLETLAVAEWDPGCGVDRDTWKAAHSPEYLTGTADYVGESDGLPWVDDLKTGHWVKRAGESRQLRSYTLPLWVRAGCPADWLSVASITQWERYPLSAQPRRFWADLTGLDMIEHLGDLRYARDHPDEVNPTEDGCRWCECRPLCPAWIDEDADTSNDPALHGGG